MTTFDAMDMQICADGNVVLSELHYQGTILSLMLAAMLHCGRGRVL